MTKVHFIYIGKTKRKHQNSSFNALKLSNKDKIRLYPQWTEEKRKNSVILYPQTDFYEGTDKLFVNGIGEKKFGKTNKVEVPLFSGNIEDWDDYLKTYGKECLFYSLTGYDLYCGDCCMSKSVDEFLSLLQCKGGITQYQKYVENIINIQRIQIETFNEKLDYLTGYCRKSFIERNLIYPSFRLFMIITPPYLNTPRDDDKLLSFYRTYRTHEIKVSHEFHDAIDTIYRRAVNTIDKEVKEGVVFPICMADRIKMLFGDKCHNLYNYILTHF